MTDEKIEQPPQEELSVLDWFKAVLSRRPVPPIPALPAEDQVVRVRAAAQDARKVQARPEALLVPWRSFGALGAALMGQMGLSGTPANPAFGVGAYLLAVGLALWAWWDGELSPVLPETKAWQEDDLLVRARPLAAGVGLSVIAFALFGENRFTALNLLVWLAGMVMLVWALVVHRPGRIERAGAFLTQEAWQPRITRFALAFVLALGIGIFFRVHQLGQAVPEMFSDHAEKLWDVYDIFDGQPSIYFRRNTGREGLQMYLIAATIKLFDTGFSFLSMKIGTAFLGIFMLPYVYLLGKELGNRWVGLLAMALAGMAFWPNILARVALRFILYPAFASPALYYMVRGLRTSNRNHFIAAGAFLGLGLHGYSPFRVAPVMAVVLIAIYILHERTRHQREQALTWLGITALVALIVFLPLLRYWLQEPGVVNYRLLTRVAETETEYPGPPLQIFLQNVWDGLRMYNWSSGSIWVVTIPNKPSLDLVSGSAFVLGLALVAARYVRRRRWEDLFLIAAIPVLQLPSTLSLAFPGENPAPNRAGGTMVVVFVLAAIGLETLLRGMREKIGGTAGSRVAAAAGFLLVFTAMNVNYRMMFEVFSQQYRSSVWNTSELGAVVEQFTDTGGGPDNAWVVSYPHWVDTRLVAINAGFPKKDLGVWPEDIEAATQSVTGPKLFLYKPEDIEAGEVLAELYPEGRLSLYEARLAPQNFFVYYVP